MIVSAQLAGQIKHLVSKVFEAPPTEFAVRVSTFFTNMKPLPWRVICINLIDNNIVLRVRVLLDLTGLTEPGRIN